MKNSVELLEVGGSGSTREGESCDSGRASAVGGGNNMEAGGSGGKVGGGG
jgi:hypothetical protein